MTSFFDDIPKSAAEAPQEVKLGVPAAALFSDIEGLRAPAKPVNPHSRVLPSKIAPLARFGEQWLGQTLTAPFTWTGPLGKWIYKKATGEEAPQSPQEMAGFEKTLLTPEKLRGLTQSLTGDYLEPQTDMERATQETAETLGLLTSQGLGPGIPAARAATAATLGQVGKEAALGLGFSESDAEKAKLGTIIATSLTHPQLAKNYNNDLWNEVRAGAQGVIIPTSQLHQDLAIIESEMTRSGLNSTEKQVAQQMIDDIRQRTAGGQIPLTDLLEMPQQANARARQLFEQANPSGKMRFPRHTRYVNQVRNALNNSVGQYANPGWQELWQTAREVHAGIAQSEAMVNWMKDTLRENKGKSVLSGLLAQGGLGLGVGLPQAVAATAGVAAVGASAIYAGQFAVRAARNPSLRRLYARTLAAAAERDTAGFIKYATTLDRKMAHERETE